MAPHYSTLAWRIPWMEEPGRLQVHGVAKSWTWLSDLTFTFHFHALEKEIASHSSILAWRIPGTAESGGLPSMGLHRVGYDWSDLAAVAAATEELWGRSADPGRGSRDFSPESEDALQNSAVYWRVIWHTPITLQSVSLPPWTSTKLFLWKTWKTMILGVLNFSIDERIEMLGYFFQAM